MVYYRRDKIFSLRLINVLLQKFHKRLLAVVEVVGRESPHVHRHRSLRREFLLVAVLIGKLDSSVGSISDVGTLHDSVEESVLLMAHTTRHRSAFRHRVAHLERHHAIVALAVARTR